MTILRSFSRWAPGRALALCVLLLALPVRSAPARSDRAGQVLRTRIEEALADRRLRGATVGVEVRALRSGRLIYSHNGMKALVPASNQKILTAATALRELGPGYRFETALLATGPVDEFGTLRGDLVLRGGGDPTPGSPTARRVLTRRRLLLLSSRAEPEGRDGTVPGGGEETGDQFAQWAEALARRGVTRIRGDLIVDDTFFDRRYHHPDWPREQLWRYYCAPVGGLSYQDNCVLVTVRPGHAAGAKARVDLGPAVDCLRVRNLCKTNGRRHAIWFERKAGSTRITVGGYVRADSEGYTGRVSVREPCLFAGQAMAEALGARQIELSGRVRLCKEGEEPGKGARTIASRRTPLSDVLKVMLEESQNVYAEHVIKTVGAESSGDGSWKGGLRRTALMLHRLHFKPGQMALADGSGMSRKNRLCPALLCAVLVEMDGSEKGRALRGLLPENGSEGTMRRRLREMRYAGRVQAKTGYLRGVGALSGYATTLGGTEVAFSIMINDFRHGGNTAMKQIEDRIVRAILEHTR